MSLVGVEALTNMEMILSAINSPPAEVTLVELFRVTTVSYAF